MQIVLKTIFLPFVVVLLSNLPMISKGLAVENMSAEALLSSCKSGDDEAAGKPCRAYIQGYLDAVEQLTLPAAEDRSFEQRALETRAKGQIIQNGYIGRNPYCLPPGLTLADIIARLQRETTAARETEGGAALLSSILKKHYACR